MHGHRKGVCFSLSLCTQHMHVARKRDALHPMLRTAVCFLAFQNTHTHTYVCLLFSHTLTHTHITSQTVSCRTELELRAGVYPSPALPASNCLPERLRTWTAVEAGLRHDVVRVV